MKLKNQHDHTAAKKRTTQDEEDKQNKKQTSAKLESSRNTQNIKMRTQNKKSQKYWHKRQIGQKEGSSPNTKTTI